MAKPPPPGKCVHCLADPVRRNWDHLCPESWYPDTTPDNQEKWQFPSCIPCNDKYGKMESDFLSRVGLCLDPHHIASKSIVEKALRSLKPAAGRDERDRQFRTAKGVKILKSAQGIGPLPVDSVVPGLGAKSDKPDEQHPILIDAEHFRMLASKIVRGIYYLTDGLFIEETHKVDHFLLHPSVAEEMLAPFGSAGQTFVREPNFRVRRFVAHDDRMNSIFEIELWQQLRIYAALSEA